MALADDDLARIAGRLADVPGVVGVMLGGSRGRGEAVEGSDSDIGLYYRGAIDVDVLGRLARELAGPEARVTPRGGWGPWVDGGGWLNIDGDAVDLIYRDLARVEECWRCAEAGEYQFHQQAGHPLGVPDFAYPGEVALGRVLADRTGELARLRRTYGTYPPALADAVVAGLWEARFLLDGVAKAAPRGDTAYVALCCSRALLVAAHAICARAGRWVTNEKGLVAIADRQPTAPPGFAAAVTDVLALVASDPAAAVAAAREVVDQVALAVRA